MPHRKHIHVIGLDEFHLAELQTVRNADEYVFHPLVDYDHIVLPPAYDIPALLAEAREDLDNAPAVDAIIGHWDFPTTSLLPILRREYGLPSASLESVLYCEHKYWTRLAAAEAIPECTPAFQGIDAYHDAPAEALELAYPFWLKPAVAFSSYLGFRIDDEAKFRSAMATIREQIHRFAEPFRHILAAANNHATLPGDGDGATCIAEGLIHGHLCTLEGYVFNGEVVVYAILDSVRGANQVSFLSYQYPSALPEGVQQRMREAADRLLRRIGLDQTPFNIEFFWDEEADRIWLLEINPRISKSHCPIFEIATGASHHEVPIDICLGRRPRFPHAEGRFPTAAKFMPRVYEDAVVTHVPSGRAIRELQERFPELRVTVQVQEGTRLSEMLGQDSYSYELASLFFGGRDAQDLQRKFRTVMDGLNFGFSRPVTTNYASPVGG
ncbi:ATP-grasp domain-containing protein [Halorhodospira neutriphila]|uniref:ATP-grasp domain-containing protein n=1 Tax=Halorhodospira neutriphila TaxID=168379 RepID=A0ABS1E4Z3_9GAMM|nr:ATP-grasp domain-containing protein [Halorhodospira neutriphila]MBK1726813.1 hypothetical protein [Halorhodospira neutriphila]